MAELSLLLRGYVQAPNKQLKHCTLTASLASHETMTGATPVWESNWDPFYKDLGRLALGCIEAGFASRIIWFRFVFGFRTYKNPAQYTRTDRSGSKAHFFVFDELLANLKSL